MRPLLALALIVSLVLPAVAQEAEPIQLSVEEIAAALREVNDDTTFDRMAHGFGIAEAQRPIFAAHFRAIFADDAAAADFATLFATEQGQFEALSRAELAEIARNLGAGWVQDTATLGAARLPAADQRALLQINLNTLGHMSAAVCAANTRGALDPVETAQAEIAFLATLDAAEVEAHLARTRAALMAEIADDPPFVPLTPAEERRAGQAYQEAFLKGIDEHPLKPLVLEAVENFDLAPDEAICELTKISLKAALSVEGETGDLVLRLVTSG